MFIGAVKKKISIETAIDMAKAAGWDFKKDFYEQSTSSKVYDLLEIAKLKGYKKSSSSSGSTARAFFEYLSKKA